MEEIERQKGKRAEVEGRVAELEEQLETNKQEASKLEEQLETANAQVKEKEQVIKSVSSK